MGHRRQLLVGAILMAAAFATGCASKGDLDGLRNGLLQQMAQSDKAQQDRLLLLQERIGKVDATCKLLENRAKTFDEKLTEVAEIPGGLESDVAAMRRYVRDVEKNITGLRELVARQLDLQNAHITRVKTSYGSVLQQHGTTVDTMTKSLDATLADLKASIEKALKTLKEAIPLSDETIPPAPTLPANLKESATPPPAPQ